MTGPHSGPYETQDPNPTVEERYRQAGEILAHIRKGDKTHAQIAESMGMSRRTFYNRLDLINAQDLPSRHALLAIHHDRLETLLLGATDRLNSGDISNADYFRGLGVTLQVLARQAAALDLVPESAAPSTAFEDGPDWEAGESE